jgi:hypothetical protein
MPLHYCLLGALVDNAVEVLADRSGVACKLDAPVDGATAPLPFVSLPFNGDEPGVRKV